MQQRADFLDTAAVKRDLRAGYRALRRSLQQQPARSMQIWVRVTGLPEIRAARTVLAFDSVIGEPDTAAFVAWCHETGKQVELVASSPSTPLPDDPGRFDAVIVPGVAFTADGKRLGQGGGWYDRLLPELRPGCLTVGVCFASLLVGDLPVEPHDVPVGVVVTEHAVIRRPA